MERKKIFTSSGEVLYEDEIINLPYIGEGGCGNAYQLGNDKVIKIADSRIDEVECDTLKTIQNLNLPNFYRLYDILFREKSGLRTFAGTIASYHTRETVNIWMSPSSYIIESYEKLIEGAIKLGEKGIRMKDVFGNFIVNKSGITIIDVDLYSQTDKPMIDNNLFVVNGDLFSSLLRKNFMDYCGISNIKLLDRALREFFDKNVDSMHKKDFVKTLSKYPTPFDYLVERKKTSI